MAQPATEAEEHHKRGLALMTSTPKDYTAAAEAFAKAYELDRKPRYLFNLALAQRLGGHCRDAIASYRAYLETAPTEDNAANARIGLERCEKAVANEPPAPPITTAPPVAPSPAPVRVTRGAWHDDGLGNTLVISGGVSLIASVGFYVFARRAASASFEPGPLADYETNRDRAKAFQVAAVIGAGTALVLVGGGFVRYATRPARRVEVTFAPTSSGGVVAIGGSL
jgi:hypothetical protein